MIVHAQTKFTMKTVIEKSAAEAPPLRTATAKAPDIAAASVPDTLATLNVNPDKHPRKRHTAILVGNWIQQRGLSSPRHQNHARFSVERKELLDLLASWVKSPSLAHCPAVTQAIPNAAHALNTKLETNHGQQPGGPGWGG